jgi:hypothetical protein
VEIDPARRGGRKVRRAGHVFSNRLSSLFFQGSAAMDPCPRLLKPVRRLVGCCALFALLALVGGCGQKPQSIDHAEVSGKVLFQGKPLPGGQVSFVSVGTGFATSGNIDENGKYQVSAPVGEVVITVNNTMLQARKGAPVKGPPVPKESPHPGKDAEEHPIKGHWVSIPSRYADANTSDLKYTVTPGPQTHDIELAATPKP